MLGCLIVKCSYEFVWIINCQRFCGIEYSSLSQTIVCEIKQMNDCIDSFWHGTKCLQKRKFQCPKLPLDPICSVISKQREWLSIKVYQHLTITFPISLKIIHKLTYLSSLRTWISLIDDMSIFFRPKKKRFTWTINQTFENCHHFTLNFQRSK